MKNLGFGMMRLPVIGGDPTNFDYEHLNKMVVVYSQIKHLQYLVTYRMLLMLLPQMKSVRIT